MVKNNEGLCTEGHTINNIQKKKKKKKESVSNLLLPMQTNIHRTIVKYVKNKQIIQKHLLSGRKSDITSTLMLAGNKNEGHEERRNDTVKKL